jgi:multiple sugar transport system ATP-binding protein
LENVRKSYGSVEVVKGVDLAVADQELVVLVGPSGCGKSTTLRMIAGLEGITSGSIRIGGIEVSGLPPRQRDIAMVFQDYALYPHKTVYENMAFGLRVRGHPVDEIERQVQLAAGMLGIEQLLARKPSQLSGGQRQRVAMGRAIVRRPKAFLFDEPLSNLDAKLRGQVRTEIKKLHQDIAATIVYVTHDQVEAMTLADRIVVMRGGVIEQIGTPDEVYGRPRSMFVANFIGAPAMNFLSATVGESHARLASGDQLPLDDLTRQLRPGTKIKVGIRPEHFVTGAAGAPTISGVVQVTEPLGADTLVHFVVGGESMTARVAPEMRPAPGEHLTIGYDRSRVHLFDAGSGAALERDEESTQTGAAAGGRS